MKIRPAVESDIPSIVALLKKTLGDEATEKTEAYWRWKHLENPFGKSPVLLGFEGDTLVGVRAFMYWQWQSGTAVYKSVRAVDTATHPDYQGRGAFKKLTLTLLDQCKEEGVDFIFNTPNEISKIGYLKMGWTQAGRLPVNIYFCRPLNIALCFSGISRPHLSDVSQARQSSIFGHPGLSELLLQDRQYARDRLITSHTAESVQWRYQTVKVKQYYSATIESGNALLGLLFYRLKQSRWGTELRITDTFLSDPKWKRELMSLIAERIKLHEADYVTVAGFNPWVEPVTLLRIRKLRLGPMVTIKDISGSFSERLINFKAWSPSVGDMELF